MFSVVGFQTPFCSRLQPGGSFIRFGIIIREQNPNLVGGFGEYQCFFLYCELKFNMPALLSQCFWWLMMLIETTRNILYLKKLLASSFYFQNKPLLSISCDLVTQKGHIICRSWFQITIKLSEEGERVGCGAKKIIWQWSLLYLSKSGSVDSISA